MPLSKQQIDQAISIHIAARNVSEIALVVYYTESGFHARRLEEALEELYAAAGRPKADIKVLEQSA